MLLLIVLCDPCVRCNSNDIFLQDGDNWTSSHVTTFSGMDPSYVLPENVAILTLQVCNTKPSSSSSRSNSISASYERYYFINPVNFPELDLQELDDGRVLFRLAHLYQVLVYFFSYMYLLNLVCHLRRISRGVCNARLKRTRIFQLWLVWNWKKCLHIRR